MTPPALDALDLRQRHRREHAAEASAGLAVAADGRHVRQPAGVDEIHLHARAGELEVSVMFFWNGTLSAKLVGAGGEHAHLDAAVLEGDERVHRGVERDRLQVDGHVVALERIARRIVVGDAVAVLVDAVAADVHRARVAQLGHREVRGVGAVVAVALRRRVAVAVEVLGVGRAWRLVALSAKPSQSSSTRLVEIFGGAGVDAGVGVVAVADCPASTACPCRRRRGPC